MASKKATFDAWEPKPSTPALEPWPWSSSPKRPSGPGTVADIFGDDEEELPTLSPIPSDHPPLTPMATSRTATRAKPKAVADEPLEIPDGMKTTVSSEDWAGRRTFPDITIPTDESKVDFEKLGRQVFAWLDKIPYQYRTGGGVEAIKFQVSDCSMPIHKISERPMTPVELKRAVVKFHKDAEEKRKKDEAQRLKDLEEMKKLLAKYPAQAQVLIGDFSV